MTGVQTCALPICGWFPADFLDLVDCVHLCRVKLFRNSRVLGYGRLNGHVASIVSMFSKEMFGKRICTCEVLVKRNYVPMRYWKSGLCTCEVRMMEKPEVVLKEVLQRKIFFSLKEVLQRKIFFPQSNLYQNLADMWYPREKLYYIWSIFFNRDIDMLINHDESFICHG